MHSRFAIERRAGIHLEAIVYVCALGATPHSLLGRKIAVYLSSKAHSRSDNERLNIKARVRDVPLFYGAT